MKWYKKYRPAYWLYLFYSFREIVAVVHWLSEETLYLDFCISANS